MDFNIVIDDSPDNELNIKHLVERASEFGYDVVALNTVIPSSSLTGKNIVIPEPKQFKFDIKPNKNLRIMNRLTAVIADGIHSHNLMRHPAVKKYDLLALQPVGEKMLHHICTNLDIDIVCLDFSENLGFSLKKTYMGMASKKGTCFEISYAPCLKSQALRRTNIGNSLPLVETLKGKNIVISSGASKPLELRSVEDVINLGLLFGFKRPQSVAAVSTMGQVVLSHAGTRNQTGCGFVSLTGMFRLPKHQGWVVQACKVPKLSDVSALNSKRTIVEDSESSKCKKLKQNR